MQRTALFRLQKITSSLQSTSTLPIRSSSTFSAQPKMKIAITGARGTVGQAVVKACADAGHHTVQVNRTDQEKDDTPNTEMRVGEQGSPER